ncbi:LRC72 protein, partial [Phaetusa simplex]|nr:LRC72 protein [Phaetusa simplex]
QIQDLTFLIKNYCLTELYLNNNELTDISGALKHLRALQILLLHNNQLKKLDKTVKELEGMISLQTLNLFHNPLVQDPDYRLYVVYFLPSVQLLDRKSRQPQDICRCWQTVWLCHEGKLVDGPQDVARVDEELLDLTMWPFAYTFFLHWYLQVPFENPEDAVLVRAMTRSLMEFSSVDWNKVATCQERRLENKAEEPHEKLTIQFR